MLTETNRGGIRASLKQWSQRKSIPDEVLNDFIEIALTRATRALRIPPLEAYQSLPITGNGYVILPSDFMEVKEAYVVINGKNVLLERKAINEVDWNSNITSSGCKPAYFARFGNYLRVAPWTQGVDSLLNLYYFKIIPPMPDDATENWFTLYAPEVLLYGAMVELCNYTRDLDGVSLWREKFTEATNIIQAVEDRAMWNGSTIGVTLTGSTPR